MLLKLPKNLTSAVEAFVLKAYYAKVLEKVLSLGRYDVSASGLRAHLSGLRHKTWNQMTSKSIRVTSESLDGFASADHVNNLIDGPYGKLSVVVAMTKTSRSHGTWTPPTEYGHHPVITIYLRESFCDVKTLEDFNLVLQHLISVVRHEVTHQVQGMLSEAHGCLCGLPSKNRTAAPDAPHVLLPVEFYATLAGEHARMTMSGSDVRSWVRTYSFFTVLKSHNVKLWRKAVGILCSA